MLIGTTITKATAASLSDRTRAGNRKELTGAWNWLEVPRSPCRMPVTQVQYWVMSGRSTPREWFSVCTARSEANGPRISRPGLPGSTDPAKKMIRLRRTRVSSASPSRFSTYSVTHPPLPRPWPSGHGDDDRSFLLSTALDSYPVHSGAQWLRGRYAFETCAYGA